MARDSYRRRLPHWREEGGTYFVTWRLKVRQPPLDPRERGTVLAVIRHFDQQRFHLHATVVMDDHVHAILRPFPQRPLERILQSWKALTTRLLAIDGRGAPCWQEEYFDRLMRDDRELAATIEYVRRNPEARWPGLAEYPWLWLRRDH